MLDIESIQLTETEKQTIKAAFDTYLESIKNTLTIADEQYTAWLGTIHTYFLNRKILFCINRKSVNADWDDLKNELTNLDNATIFNMRPVQIVMEDLIQQSAAFNLKRQALEEKIAQEQQKKVDAIQENTELQTAAPLILADMKIEEYQQAVILIDDYLSYLTVLQLYLAEKFKLQKPEKLGSSTFTDLYFLAENSSSDIGMSNRLPNYVVTKEVIRFYSPVSSEEIRNKLFTLKNAYSQLQSPPALYDFPHEDQEQEEIEQKFRQKQYLVWKEIAESEAMSKSFDYCQSIYKQIEQTENKFLKELEQESTEKTEETLSRKLAELNSVHESSVERQVSVDMQHVITAQVQEKIENSLTRIQEKLEFYLHKIKLKEILHEINVLREEIQEEAVEWLNGDIGNIRHPAVEVENFLSIHLQTLEAMLKQPVDIQSTEEVEKTSVASQESDPIIDHEKILKYQSWILITETLFQYYLSYAEIDKQSNENKSILEKISEIKKLFSDTRGTSNEKAIESTMEQLSRELEKYFVNQKDQMILLMNDEVTSVLNDIFIRVRSIQAQFVDAWSTKNSMQFAKVVLLLNEIISSLDEMINNNGVQGVYSPSIEELWPFLAELKEIRANVTNEGSLQTDMLASEEVSKLWSYFYLYAIDKNGPIQKQETINWAREQEVQWFLNRYKKHFARLKMHALQSGLDFSLDKALDEYGTDFIWYLRPAKELMREFANNRNSLESFKTLVLEKVKTLGADCDSLQQKISKLTSEKEKLKSEKKPLMFKAEIKNLDFKITKYTYQLHDFQAKITYFNSVANEISDMLLLLKALQAYLAETQYIEDFPASVSDVVFSQMDFKETRFVSKNKELYTRPNLLKTALRNARQIEDDTEFFTKLYVGGKYQVKYNTLTEIFKLENAGGEMNVFAAKIGPIHQRLSHCKGTLAKVNAQLKPHENYIVDLLNEAKRSLLPALRNNLTKLQEKLKSVTILSDEEIIKLEETQQIEAKFNATLPGKIADLEKYINGLDNVQPEQLDQDRLTPEQVALCSFVLDAMLNTENNIERYNAIIQAHRKKQVKQVIIQGEEKDSADSIITEEVEGIDVHSLQQRTVQEDNNSVKRKPLILQVFSGGPSKNLIGYFAEKNNAVLAYLDYLKKQRNSKEVFLTLAYHGAWKTFWEVMGTLPKNTDELNAATSKIDRDYAEIQKIIIRKEEWVQPDDKEKISDLLKKFSDHVNCSLLQNKFDHITPRNKLAEISGKILGNSTWREHLDFGLSIEHPVIEMLYIFDAHVKNKPEELLLKEQKEWLEKTIIWLKEYVEFHYDSDSKKTGKEFSDRAKKILNSISKRLAQKEKDTHFPSDFDRFVGDIAMFHSTEIKDNLQKASAQQEDFENIQQFLTNLAFAFSSSFNTGTVTWADKYIQCPYYALFKLKTELTSAIKLAKKYAPKSEFVKLLEDMLTKLDTSINQIQQLYQWDLQKIEAVNKAYNDKASKTGAEQSGTLRTYLTNAFNTFRGRNETVSSSASTGRRAPIPDFTPARSSTISAPSASNSSATPVNAVKDDEMLAAPRHSADGTPAMS